ncbi:1-phosphatidylinositol 4,5-bisphosphate phosphodiesterase delta-3-like [Chiloscyllium plagiosum]|uniref:1-phosphatidylinositol 4,5-bisphosphate phosphodiesterase delta-3-like n=1 Tax=Chiloscyllium plagiosum TaxID=36176 RepID=UPI001CB868F2|nr:1-phosphatidylinositol 4,5-bisphosphate phosphodiesterase delta-3-like [Chiloscyllium plagiosum]
MIGTRSRGSQLPESDANKLALKAFRKVGLQDDEDVKFMLKGSKLKKVKSGTWKKNRRLKLQEDGLSIWCESRNKAPTFSVMDIRDIQEGHRSEVMKKHGSSFSEKRCFTIMFTSSRTNLDLVAESEEEGRRWVQGLKKLISRVETMSQREKIEHLIHQHLEKADKNNDNKISFKEVKNLLKMINLKVDDDYVNFLFQQCDKSRTNTLEEHEIEEFCNLLMQRPELEEIFQHFSGHGQWLTVGELENFLKEQKEVSVAETCLSIMQKYGLHDNAKQDQLLTQDGFMMYLLSPDGDMFNSDHDKVYQDMTQPLSHYFISTSHNTYLMEDQLGGPSSTEAYIRALLRGCRCVELDCWEGPNEEPIIYHGYTLTSKILFKDVIRTIRDYAFTVSLYPVILSLENHCGVEQQTVMARHLKEILGEMLITAPLDGKVLSELPSPERLKRKILIKGKKLQNAGSTPEQLEEIADEYDEENVKNDKKSKKKLTSELSDLVIYCQSTHFQSLEQTWSKQAAHETSSFSETKAKKLIAENGPSFVLHNTLQLSKVYPLGSRIHSSNFNPQEMWNGGCQLGKRLLHLPRSFTCIVESQNSYSTEGSLLAHFLCAWSSLAITLSPSLSRHHSLAITLSPSLSRHHSLAITLSPSLSRHHSLAITLSPSLSRHHSLAITLSPSLSRHHSLAITLSPSLSRHHSLAITLSPSLSRHHSLAITLSPSLSRHHSLAITLSPSLSRHHSLAITLSPSLSRHHSLAITCPCFYLIVTISFPSGTCPVSFGRLH